MSYASIIQHSDTDDTKLVSLTLTLEYHSTTDIKAAVSVCIVCMTKGDYCDVHKSEFGHDIVPHCYLLTNSSG